MHVHFVSVGGMQIRDTRYVLQFPAVLFALRVVINESNIYIYIDIADRLESWKVIREF